VKPATALGRIPRRLLGVLIEKAFCTPDQYPLTLNAAVAGSNQKSNRDPGMDLTVEQCEEGLDALKKLGLVECIFPASGRTERWRHVLKEAWALDGRQRAVIGELLLRGPQTQGDLRTRASRMQDLPTLEDLAAVLGQLAERGFVKRLSPEGQKRGVMWMHLLYPDEEGERLAEKHRTLGDGGEDDGEEDRDEAPSPRRTSTASDDRARELESQVAELKSRLADLAEAHDALAVRVQELETRFGG
jgi:uncharacterized protein YceH (UPF0502 family)